MSYLVDTTYFAKGQLAINNVTDTGFAGLSVAENVSDYVARYEPVYLTKLLGATLYAYLVAHQTEPRIVALIAKLRNSTDKISPIASYIYYRYMQENQVIQTEGGDKETAPAGMTTMANLAKHCAIWNWMSDQSTIINDWLTDNLATYPEFSQTSDEDLESWELFEHINTIL